jgi:hypothetical protein
LFSLLARALNFPIAVRPPKANREWITRLLVSDLSSVRWDAWVEFDTSGNGVSKRVFTILPAVAAGVTAREGLSAVASFNAARAASVAYS